MNLTLLKAGYPIANISGDTASRLAYYSALEKCNIKQDKTEFYDLIASYVVHSLERLLQLVKK